MDRDKLLSILTGDKIEGAWLCAMMDQKYFSQAPNKRTSLCQEGRTTLFIRDRLDMVISTSLTTSLGEEGSNNLAMRPAPRKPSATTSPARTLELCTIRAMSATGLPTSFTSSSSRHLTRGAAACTCINDAEILKSWLLSSTWLRRGLPPLKVKANTRSQSTCQVFHYELIKMYSIYGNKWHLKQ